MQPPSSTTRLSPVERWHHVTPLERRLRAVLGSDYASAYLFMLPTFLILGGLIAYHFARAHYVSCTNTVRQGVRHYIGVAY